MANDIQRFDESKPINKPIVATVFVNPTGFASLVDNNIDFTIVNSGQLDDRFDDVLYYVSG